LTIEKLGRARVEVAVQWHKELPELVNEKCKEKVIFLAPKKTNDNPKRSQKLEIWWTRFMAYVGVFGFSKALLLKKAEKLKCP
jgi:hypothetical protein